MKDISQIKRWLYASQPEPAGLMTMMTMVMMMMMMMLMMMMMMMMVMMMIVMVFLARKFKSWAYTS